MPVTDLVTEIHRPFADAGHGETMTPRSMRQFDRSLHPISEEKKCPLTRVIPSGNPLPSVNVTHNIGLSTALRQADRETHVSDEQRVKTEALNRSSDIYAVSTAP